MIPSVHPQKTYFSFTESEFAPVDYSEERDKKVLYKRKLSTHFKRFQIQEYYSASTDATKLVSTTRINNMTFPLNIRPYKVFHVITIPGVMESF